MPKTPPKARAASSPRPEQLGMGSTSPARMAAAVQGKAGPLVLPPNRPMASKAEQRRVASQLAGLTPDATRPTALPPDQGPLSAFGQRQVMWFHHPDNYHVMGVVWAEHENLVKAGAPAGAVRIVKCYHILHRSESGGVEHHRARPQDQPHLTPISATTTVTQFEEYLRGCAQKFGCASKEVWGLLGLEAPVVTVETRPETAPGHAELYERAARLLGTPEPELRAKYGHLNPGLQAMNLRNRLRAKGHNV